MTGLYALDGVGPTLGRGVYVAPSAVVIGDVVLGDRVSVWFGAVLRGDEAPIRIGAGCNVQDGVIVHANRGGPEVVLCEQVTVGHGARLHGCTIGAGALIGIGAIVLDGAVVGEGALVAAGALVPPGKVIAAGELWSGEAAVRRRALREAERQMLRDAPAIYEAEADRYARGCRPIGAHGPGG